MTMIEPGGRARCSAHPGCRSPFHGLPKLLTAKAFTLADKLALAKAFGKLMRPVPQHQPKLLSHGSQRNGQTPGAIEPFWRLVIASALNADLMRSQFRTPPMCCTEVFLKSARAGHMGMSTVPLSELYGDAEHYLQARGCSVHYNSNIDSITWDEEALQWSVGDRALQSDFLVLALPLKPRRNCCRICLLPRCEPLAQRLSYRQHWPICSVHLWFDREITDLDHAVLLTARFTGCTTRAKIPALAKTPR